MHTFQFLITNEPSTFGRNNSAKLKLTYRIEGTDKDVQVGQVQHMHLYLDGEGKLQGHLMLPTIRPAWVADFMIAYPEVAIFDSGGSVHPSIAALWSDIQKHRPYVGVILVTPEFSELFKDLPDSSFDRESEMRLIEMGVIGYYQGTPVMVNPLVTTTTGYLLV